MGLSTPLARSCIWRSYQSLLETLKFEVVYARPRFFATVLQFSAYLPTGSTYQEWCRRENNWWYGDQIRQPLSLLRHGVYVVRLWFGSLWSSVLRGQRGGDPTSQQASSNTNSYSSHMDSPPDNDCCSVCHDSFTLPCQANCAHWFCGECFLYHSILWHIGGKSVRDGVSRGFSPATAKVSREFSGFFPASFSGHNRCLKWQMQIFFSFHARS